MSNGRKSVWTPEKQARFEEYWERYQEQKMNEARKRDPEKHAESERRRRGRTVVADPDYAMPGGDPLAVRTQVLAAYVREFVEKFDAEHPRRDPTGKANTGMTGFGGMQYLALQSGLPVRSIERVKQEETSFTSLRVADLIIQAMERPDLLHANGLEPVPNPIWSKERWAEWQRLNGGCDE